MKLKDELSNMTQYEKCKLLIDTLRFLATAAAPFLVIGLGYYTKHYLQW